MNDFNYFIDDLPFWSAPFGLRLLECLKFKKAATVLDIGCGEGFPIVEIAARFGSTGCFVGIDPLNKPLKRVCLKKQLYRLPTVWAVQTTAEDLPFVSGTIDCIVSNNGLNNVTDIDRCLKECRRVIHPAGQMVFTANTPDTMKEFYAVFKQVLKTFSPETIDRIQEQISKKRLSKQAWQSRLHQEGFKIEKILMDRFTLSFADGTAMLDHYLIRQFFLPGWQALVEEDKRDAIFSRIEEILNREAGKQGKLTLSVPFLTFDCRPQP